MHAVQGPYGFSPEQSLESTVAAQWDWQQHVSDTCSAAAQLLPTQDRAFVSEQVAAVETVVLDKVQRHEIEVT